MNNSKENRNCKKCNKPSTYVYLGSHDNLCATCYKQTTEMKETKATGTKEKTNIDKNTRCAVWRKYNNDKLDGKCYCCETRDISFENFQVGHVVSRADGGDNHIENLRPVCNSCNQSMGTQNLELYKKNLHESNDWRLTFNHIINTKLCADNLDALKKIIHDKLQSNHVYPVNIQMNGSGEKIEGYVIDEEKWVHQQLLTNGKVQDRTHDKLLEIEEGVNQMKHNFLVLNKSGQLNIYQCQYAIFIQSGHQFFVYDNIGFSYKNNVVYDKEFNLNKIQYCYKLVSLCYPFEETMNNLQKVDTLKKYVKKEISGTQIDFNLGLYFQYGQIVYKNRVFGL